MSCLRVLSIYIYDAIYIQPLCQKSKICNRWGDVTMRRGPSEWTKKQGPPRNGGGRWLIENIITGLDNNTP